MVSRSPELGRLGAAPDLRRGAGRYVRGGVRGELRPHGLLARAARRRFWPPGSSPCTVPFLKYRRIRLDYTPIRSSTARTHVLLVVVSIVAGVGGGICSVGSACGSVAERRCRRPPPI